MNLYIPTPLPDKESLWVFSKVAPEPPYIRIGASRKRYGLNAVDVTRLLRRQGLKCAVCRGKFTDEEGIVSGYVIDHNHHSVAQGTKLAVRGLLCRDCNLFITHHAMPEYLEKAAAYLRKSSAGFRKRQRRLPAGANP